MGEEKTRAKKQKESEKAKMRDRLIELIEEWDRQNEIESIADYLLANGVIVPPCKIGDTVWVVSQGQGMNMRWDVYEGKVSDIHINTHADLEIRAKNGENFFGYYKPCSVFLTKEEAERALAERSAE